MNDDTRELARRAVALPHWRWMPGMLCLPVGGGFHVRYNGVVSCDMPDAGGVRYVPDLTDPATLGCLLALVREAIGEPLACVEVRQPGDLGCRACVRVPVGSEGWRVLQWWCASQCPVVSEIAALVAVLESAPEVKQ